MLVQPFYAGLNKVNDPLVGWRIRRLGTETRSTVASLDEMRTTPEFQKGSFEKGAGYFTYFSVYLGLPRST